MQWNANTTRSRGYEHDSCGLCKQCLTGQEIYCAERAMYALADLDQGSFASHAVWREAFLFKIPDALSDEAAAPLYVPQPLCHFSAPVPTYLVGTQQEEITPTPSKPPPNPSETKQERLLTVL